MSQRIPRTVPALLILLAIFSLTLLGSATPAAAQGDGWKKHIEFSAAIAPAKGEFPPRLVITTQVSPDWHIYSVTQPKGGPKVTKISVEESTEYKLVGEFKPTVAPHIKPPDVFPVNSEEHEGTFMWVAPLEIKSGINLAQLTVAGTIKGQVCDPSQCINFSTPFEAELDSSLVVPATVDITVSAPSASDSQESSLGLWTALGLAFLGGIILNVMPCVLPVIGLKVLAFIEQGGQSRSKIFLLNFWYSAGVIAVWLALAALATLFQLGLGELFQSAGFSIVMAAVIFVMGLSFLGIWEIPIPGFIGTEDVTKLGEREGYEGAFAKGTITTILATPCLGPFMGGLFIGLLGRPSYEVYAIFFSIGLGMSSPYLVLGLLPQATRYLPKPGAWMNTFKEIMGFLLIGTTVYLLTVLKMHLIIPTMVLMIGLGTVCWWIGRVPPTADPSRRWRALGEGILVSTLIGLAAFFLIAPDMEARVEFDRMRFFDTEIERMISDGELVLKGELPVFKRPWQPYTERKFNWLMKHNKPVLIDFTADWCLTCKMNEKAVLKTDSTTRFLQEHGVYSLVADWTHDDEAIEVTKKLNELGVEAIPLVAIYRPGDPKNPILIPGTLTKAELRADVLKALEQTQMAEKPGPASRQ